MSETNRLPQIIVPRTSDAIAFLEKMHPEGPWHLVAIVPDARTNALSARTFTPAQRDEAFRWIDERQRRTNLYFHVNRLKPDLRDKRAQKGHVAEAMFLHVDIDDPDGLDRLAAFEIPPTVVVFSGGGYQAFWRLAAGHSDLNRVERCNAALERTLGGDSCHNVDRIMVCIR